MIYPKAQRKKEQKANNGEVFLHQNNSSGQKIRYADADGNRYDENILFYLVKYFEGSIRELQGLLRNSEGFAVDTYTLVERLLVQSLFAGVYIGEKMKLYSVYMQMKGMF